jgi:hypothetical protein
LRDEDHRLSNDGIDEDLGIHAKGLVIERLWNAPRELLSVELAMTQGRAKKVTRGRCKIAVQAYRVVG